MREYTVTKDLHELVGADFPNYELKIDKCLSLFEKFASLLKSDNKLTTVRYGCGKVRLPKSNKIPLFETREGDKIYQRFIGFLEISKVVVKKFQELTEADGIRDGFTGKSELVGVIESIYGKIKPDDLVSIYYVKLS